MADGICNTPICTESDRLMRIETKLDKFGADLRGNGHAGLFTEFAVMKAKVGGLIFMNVLILGSIVALWVKTIGA